MKSETAEYARLTARLDEKSGHAGAGKNKIGKGIFVIIVVGVIMLSLLYGSSGVIGFPFLLFFYLNTRQLTSFD